jgi:glycosyltransferase involved in cell wall biosynthesis
MPVYNGEPFVGAAIASVLGQTLHDLELVIVENGSRDGSRETARAAAARDPRVRLVEHPEPLGIVGAGNAGVRATRAALVARQDQDDLSHPRRLERQVAALDRAPEAVAIGTLSIGVDAAGRHLRPRDRWRLIRRCPLPPFPHGSACLRRDAFERVGGYREGTYRWEDIDLFLRLEREGPVLVLPQALYHYRYHERSLTASGGGRDEGAALMWRCVDAHRRGSDWSELLASTQETQPAAAAVRARAARHRDGMRLWSGAALDDSEETPATATARARRAWQRASPTTLRAAKRAAIRLRDLAAAPLLPRDTPVRWRPR